MTDWFYKHRIIARLFILVYITFFSWTTYWYMQLPDPSESQTGFITALFGIGAAWYALYLRSVKEQKNGKETNEEEEG
jgi:hypothetical protein